MKFISLLTGIGGIDLGLEWAGMECVAQVEIDDYCQKVLTKHWPDVPKFKDVKDVGKSNLPAADLICGGLPCQPHSLAGKRQASEDDRDLWPEFARIIRECQPGWVLAENVPGILSGESGQFFGGILRDLAASGYDVEWQSLPAAAFGAPHIRERVIIVAHHKSKGIRQLPIFAWRPQQKSNDIIGICKPVSNANDERREKLNDACIAETTDIIGREDNAGNVANSYCQPAGWFAITWKEHYFWSIESKLGRVANGVPNRVDRIGALGNAVVPQVAEFVGRCIIQAENQK